MSQCYLDAQAVIRSLKIAFESPVDANTSSQRIRGFLSHLPASSLYMKSYHKGVFFYESTGSDILYLNKQSDRLYLLARKRYLETLLQTIELAGGNVCDNEAWEKQFEKLAKLISQYAKGNLDVARIVLTNRQYGWLTRPFKQKQVIVKKNETPLKTDNGVIIRSKSEQNIGNRLWHLGIPNHFEEQLQINVMRLANELESYLSETHQLSGSLYYYHRGVCYWNVPEHLQFMNASGSVWHTFNYLTGCITIHPDYTIMLIDSSLLYWEHEGLLIDFVYRTNAAERVAIMRICGDIDQHHLLQTTENESNDRQVLDEIIKTQIVPRIWF